MDQYIRRRLGVLLTVVVVVVAVTAMWPESGDTQPLLAPSTSTTVASEPAAAVISPAGLVLPVRSVTTEGWVVGTPCFEEAHLVDAEPILGDVQVVIDPGHGGVEDGARGPNGLTEAELNLAVAERLRAWLADHGVTAVLTRTSDTRVALTARAEIIRALAPEIAVSIHHNAGTVRPSAVPGTLVFHQVDDDASRRIGGLIYEELVAALTPLDLDWVYSADPGVFSAARPEDGADAYGILRHSRPIPTVISEALFLQNASEAEALATPAVQQLEAEALGRAILRYLETDDPGSGFTDPRIYNFSISASGGTDGCIDPPLD